MMRPLLLLVLASATVLAAGCMDDGGRGGGGDLSLENAVATDVVDMKSNKYVPAAIRVPVGTNVTWTNSDMVGHTITPGNESQWGGPGSGDKAKDWVKGGESWSWTFTESGTYYYYCVPHGYENTATGEVGGMAGVVYVEGTDGGTGA